MKQEDYRYVKSRRYERPWGSSGLSLAVKYDYALLLLSEEFDYDHCMELTIGCEHCTFDLTKQQKLQIYGYPAENKEQDIQNYKEFQYDKPFKLSQWGK